ncbi:MAG: hypothetical protein K2M07_01000 [Muribaculaceae bacterium]|nr:hypothetical protein [Muribaculaceae bacterium]
MGTNLEKLRRWVILVMEEVRGRNVGTFMVFLVISALFWLLMALNDDVQRDFVVPVKLENVPADVTLLTSEPTSLNLTIKDKGSALVRYALGSNPTLTFDFADISADNNRIVITRQKANNAIRGVFGQAQVMALNPDSISVPFTRRPPKTVKVRLNTEDVSTAPQFIISGGITFTPDTVRLYSARPIRDISSITTEPVSANNLRDTTEIEVRLIPPEGMRAIPATVKVKIPVEPLILANRSVPIEVENGPSGKRVVVFPAEAKVSYLIPMNVYNSGDQPTFRVIADFSRRSRVTGRMPLILPALPKTYRNPMLLTDSAEYLIEQH